MRVNAQTKAATRQRILDAARRRFASNGFDACTTRDISDAAGIANGTLFNYFTTKEAILASLAAEAVEPVHGDFTNRTGDPASFEATLFALVAAELRRLKPWRQHVTVLLETAFNPLANGFGAGASSLRGAHLEAVAGLAKTHGLGELSIVALQLYGALYAGVLGFWARDRSPKQEDTLALLDQSVSMFVGWLHREAEEKTKERDKPCPPP